MTVPSSAKSSTPPASTTPPNPGRARLEEVVAGPGRLGHERHPEDLPGVVEEAASIDRAARRRLGRARFFAWSFVGHR